MPPESKLSWDTRKEIAKIIGLGILRLTPGIIPAGIGIYHLGRSLYFYATGQSEQGTQAFTEASLALIIARGYFHILEKHRREHPSTSSHNDFK